MVKTYLRKTVTKVLKVILKFHNTYTKSIDDKILEWISYFKFLVYTPIQKEDIVVLKS